MKYLAALLIILISSLSNQIEHPVKWQYGIQQIGSNTYQIHLKGIIEQPWHIYSQHQPDDAIAIPTKIVFKTDDGVELISRPKEVGKLEKFEDKSTGIVANEFAGQIDFIQMIRLKYKGRKTISGIITFQACNNRQCLQPEDIPFKIEIVN